MISFNDLLPTMEQYRTLFDSDPPDLIDMWDFDELKNDMLKAIDAGVPIPEADGGEAVPINT